MQYYKKAYKFVMIQVVIQINLVAVQINFIGNADKCIGHTDKFYRLILKVLSRGGAVGSSSGS